MKTIVVYPGRFQPFGPHHFKSYQWLCAAFGKANVYICTSNKTGPNSPLEFSEKRRCILKYNVLPSNIILTKEPYKPIELLKNFDQNNTSVIFALGHKDKDRIPFFKKDGMASWFREYYGQKDLLPLATAGYIVELPHIKLTAVNVPGGDEVSGAYLRKTLPLATQKEFAAVMGYYDPDIHYMFKKRFHPDIIEPFGDIRTEGARLTEQNFKKFNKHISHPFEDDLTWTELSEFITDVCRGNAQGSIKRDGYNLQVTYRSGQFKAARSKSTILSPLGKQEMIEKYTEKPIVQQVFLDGITVIENICRGLGEYELDQIFGGGNTFVNFEILNPKNTTVFPAKEPEIYLHSMITYDSSGNELSRDTDIPFDISRNYNSPYKVYKSNLQPIAPNNGLEVEENILSQLEKLEQLQTSSKFDTAYELKKLIFKFGSIIIYDFCKKNIKDWSPKDEILKILSDIDYDNLPDVQRRKYDDSIIMLSKIGGPKMLSPIEGLVIPWRGKTYKLTGAFGALVPILIDIYNKNRINNE